jgi:MRG-binding protein
MHKHFRVIAISEHLRNHGFDPDIETHTRIPGIWKKLREFYDMDMIDERDNSFDYVRSLGGDEAPEEIYKDFELAADDFHDMMWARAAADENEPDNWSGNSEAGGDNNNNNSTNNSTTTTNKKNMRKRKRGADNSTAGADTASVAGSATAKTRRSSTVDDTDRETPVVSSPVSRSARGARSQKRAAAKAKTESPESDHDDEGEDEEEDGDNDSSDGEEEEEEEEEVEAPTTRSGRGGSSARGRGRGRGRGKAGRKKG